MPEGRGLTNLTEVELVVKANTACDLMDVEKEWAPEVLCFVGAKKLTRGGILFDLNSAEVALWLWRTNVRDTFMEKFSRMSCMRDIECKVLGEFIPIDFEPDAASAITCIKEDSGLEANAISRVTWAKVPA
jgi:hypothetical protein